MATFQVDDPAAIVIGTPITDRLETPGVVRALEIRFQDHELRVLAWVGVGAVDRSKLAGLLNALARRALDGRVFGVYRYRVVRLAVDGRLELQAVRQLPGLPDLAPISVWPGVAGAHADLQLGTEVLVQFVEGDRAQPIVTGFAGLQGPGFSPATLTLGDEAGQPAARQGDAVEVLIPPAIFTGTIVVSGTPSPASGVVSWLITAGSAKVKIA
jgi:hypothetical protein